MMSRTVFAREYVERTAAYAQLKRRRKTKKNSTQPSEGCLFPSATGLWLLLVAAESLYSWHGTTARD